MNTGNGTLGSHDVPNIDCNEDSDLALAIFMSLEDQRIEQETEFARIRQEREVIIDVPTSNSDVNRENP